MYSSLLILSSLATFSLLPNVSAEKVNCDCGFYQEDTKNVWANAQHVTWSNYTGNINKDKTYLVASYKVPSKFENTVDRVYSTDNVKTDANGLELVVTPQNGDTPLRGGSVSTSRKDILYGSFRAVMKIPMQAGTVSAFYFYESDEAELDIELLSYIRNPSQVYWAIHPSIKRPDGSADPLTHGTVNLDVDTAADYHEYRFDWSPGKADFYFDGQFYNTYNTNIPSVPGKMIFNHWSDGNPNFSKGPPTETATLSIRSHSFFFNTSGNNALPCQNLKQACSVSDVLSGRIEPEIKSMASKSLYLLPLLPLLGGFLALSF
ncbi:concanavalin A-like lectin/glucanase [Basidiobolus meristosporus CBS 931.73]|uniref:Concanavalin A-like lectin/glucanase n=1 Tax=Basidiobolus meristosporus CBS 931.73 TaxID=1314790 RepID=A0A1Y1YHB0_9FUNG|nr:concanavalin A-like lectin/glucanase [Basidiobolus meristosporus CBS 931.73]|eukprot:ORX97338.1 concanavalin A-like lectin/glucanase [Basidiobolus meristosporus CBS 931.73]